MIVVLYIMVSNPCVRNMTLDFHPGNFLISRTSGYESIRDIIEAEKSRGISYEEEFDEYKKDGLLIRIYSSQPLVTLLPGDSISINDVSVKIADFGKGMSLIQFT